MVGLLAGLLPAHDPPACLRALDAAIREQSRDPALYFQRGEVYLGIDAPRQALADFDRTLELRPDYPGVHVGRGRALLRLGRHPEAFAAAVRELARDPQCGEAAVLRARALAAQGEHVRALDAWDAALALVRPARPEYYLERADAAVSADALREALAGLDRAMRELGPVITLQERAIALCEQAGDWREGVRRLDLVLPEVARPESWLAWKARLLERAGQPAAAAAVRRAALAAIEALPGPRSKTAASRALVAGLSRQLHGAPIVPPAPLPFRTERAPATLESTTAPAALEAAAPAPVLASGNGEILVPRGSYWRYSDAGIDLGTVWILPVYDDSLWPVGSTQLGFGDGDESHLVNGGSPTNRTPTIYFRHPFTVQNPVWYTRAHIELLCDDGAIVYLNGTEIARVNMPAGPTGYATLALQERDAPEERTYYPISFPPNLLVAGRNVLAVEVHQASATSDDLSFDLEVVATANLSLARGPYLQQTTATSTIVRWRTDSPCPTACWLGSAPDSVQLVHSDATPRTEHEVRLTDLTPARRYYYAIGDGTQRFAGPGIDYWFMTAPPTGTRAPMRIWALGDCGTGDAHARAVRDAFHAFAGTRPADLVLLLGDNAYYSGTDIEHSRYLFAIYDATFRHACAWPTFGNHDAIAGRSLTQTGPYYDSFTLPTAGECGGLPSGTEAYYSFDYGNVHFVCLDSQDGDRSPSGAMLTWLDADLRATTAEWVIAFFHHPPYSKGVHDSDNAGDSSGRLRDMRVNALPILEQHGVDLVLTGHSHSYERSFLLHGHYGTSDTLTPAMILDRGDGRADGDGTYGKRSLGRVSGEGAVYVVAGSAGMTSGGALNHPANYVSFNLGGSLVVDIDGTRLDAYFVDATGTVRDRFTMEKGVRRMLTRVEPTISAASGGQQQLDLDAGTAHAGRQYLVAGSFGTTPGFELNGVTVPLNPDGWFTTTVTLANSAFLQNTAGQLDEQGKARAFLSVPSVHASIVGTELYHAFVVFDGGRVIEASNAVKVRFVP